MTSDADRREYKRLPKSFRVEISEFVFPLASQPKYEVTSADISAGGLRVECPHPFNSGDKVQVRVYIASFNKFHPGFLKVFESDVGQYLQAIAEVAWVETRVGSCQLGLRFLDVDEDDWAALKRMIERQLEETGS